MSNVRRRLVLVALVLVGSCVVVVVPQATPVAAQESCLQKVIPGDALDGATLFTGATGAYAAGSSTLLAGGATAAVTLSAGTVGLVAGTFLGTVAGTCKFLDWATRDGDWVPDPPPIIPTSSITVSDLVPCTSTNTGSGDPTLNRCRVVTLGSALTAPGYVFSTNDETRNWHSGSLILSEPASSGRYASSPNWYHPSTGAIWQHPTNLAINCHGGIFGGTGFVSPSLSSGCPLPAGTTSFEVIFPQCGQPEPSTTTTYGNVGGNCGFNPSSIFYITTGPYTGPSDSDIAVAFFHPNPTARSLGWERKVIADVRCRAGVNGAYSWVRAETPTFYDRELDERMQIPSCATGQIPVETLVRRVPRGVYCPLGSIPASGVGVYCDASTVITRVVVPDTLTAAGTAPAWVTCLAVGTDCGAPVLNTTTGTCSWGTHSVPASYCDAEKQAGNPSTNPETVAQPTGTIEPQPYTPNEPSTTTGQPAPEPGGGEPGTGTGAAIDPGDGLRPPGGYSEEDTDECWPVGWGWFNPAEWVLKPIKCALVWAFVPDGDSIEATFTAFTDALFEQFPFSLIQLSVDFLGTMGDALEGAGGSGCFTVGNWSFGSYGTVDAGDVCLDGLSPTSGQRSTVMVIMLAPMVWALLTHAWLTFLNGRQVGGN